MIIFLLYPDESHHRWQKALINITVWVWSQCLFVSLSLHIFTMICCRRLVLRHVQAEQVLHALILLLKHWMYKEDPMCTMVFQQREAQNHLYHSTIEIPPVPPVAMYVASNLKRFIVSTCHYTVKLKTSLNKLETKSIPLRQHIINGTTPGVTKEEITLWRSASPSEHNLPNCNELSSFTLD